MVMSELINFGHDTTLMVVAPHPDDEVIGCGGLIAKVKEAGGSVHVLFLTVAATQDFSTHGSSTAQERTDEIVDVAKALRIDTWHVAFSGEEYHLRLDQLAQKDLIHVIERGEGISLESLQPAILAFPQLTDYNQDHRAAALACMAACRPAPRQEKFIPDFVLSYESPMNAWNPYLDTRNPNFIIPLSEEGIRIKMRGMKLYESQVRGVGHPRHVKNLEALARLRGSLIGEEFGEAYHCLKLAA